MEGIEKNNSEEKAEQEIRSKMQEAHSMGGNDSEISDMEYLISQMRDKEITPKEALQKASQIIERKNSYH